jgi:hypothetical protein
MALLKKGHLDHREGVILSSNPKEALDAAGRYVAGQPVLVPDPKAAVPPSAQTQAS